MIWRAGDKNMGKEIFRRAKDIRSLLDLDDIGQMAYTLAQFWRSSPNSNMRTQEISIDDPIYGKIRIERELSPLLSHPIVSRLDYVAQLSFSRGEYPSSTHTRLSHSLGVLQLISDAWLSIFTRDRYYTPSNQKEFDLSKDEKKRTILKAKVAGLLHDSGHGPFSHNVDRLVGYEEGLQSYPDKVYSKRYIQDYLQETLEKCGLEVKEIINILEGGQASNSTNPLDKLTADLVDSDCDVDRLDYLVRDSHFTGLLIGQMNVKAIINEMVPFKEDEQYQLCFRKSVIPYLRDFVYGHAMMYSNCYESWKKAGCERYLLKCVKELRDRTDIRNEDLMLLTDEQLLFLIMISATKNEKISNLLDLFLRPQRFELVFEGTYSSERGEEGEKDYRKFEDYIGDIGGYSRPYLKRSSEWEEEICERAGLRKDECWKIAISLPTPEGIRGRGFATRVLTECGKKWCAKEASNIDKDLEKLYKLLHEKKKFRVFVDSRLGESKKREIRKTAEDFFRE